MLRYLVFAGQAYYANNGWYDCRGACATLEEAHRRIDDCARYGLEWYQLIDLETLQILATGRLNDSDHAYGDADPEELDHWRQFLEEGRHAEPPPR